MVAKEKSVQNLQHECSPLEHKIVLLEIRSERKRLQCSSRDWEIESGPGKRTCKQLTHWVAEAMYSRMDDGMSITNNNEKMSRYAHCGKENQS